MMMTALMMRPIWTPAMAEHVIASVLRKLGPRGDVSHEEALGGQAIRENAVVYDSLVRLSRLEAAREVLAQLQTTRENYHMIDDEFQLPVLAAQYLADSAVSAGRKREFLFDASFGQPRLTRLLRELALVATRSRAYVEAPEARNLVSFPKRDATHWRSASWRDSDAGYAGGRFAMDVNAIWVPQALEATATILESLRAVGLGPAALDSIAPGMARRRWARQPGCRLAPPGCRALARSQAPLRGDALPGGDPRPRPRASRGAARGGRRFWETVTKTNGSDRDSLRFLVLSLDADGKPYSDRQHRPGDRSLLEPAASAQDVRLDLAPIMRPYPVGLFVEGLGPLVANDATRDAGHGKPREGLGITLRESSGTSANLLLLGLTDGLMGGGSGLATDAGGGRRRSGFQHNELWSYGKIEAAGSPCVTDDSSTWTGAVCPGVEFAVRLPPD